LLQRCLGHFAVLPKVMFKRMPDVANQNSIGPRMLCCFDCRRGPVDLDTMADSDAWQPAGTWCTYLCSVTLASGKFAVVEKSKDFTLVPWRLEMEHLRGKTLPGTAGSEGINWDWNVGRSRGLGVS
jgi:hypothetical protein